MNHPVSVLVKLLSPAIWEVISAVLGLVRVQFMLYIVGPVGRLGRWLLILRHLLLGEAVRQWD